MGVKIKEATNGTPVQAGDAVPVDRGGLARYVELGTAASSAIGDFDAAGAAAAAQAASQPLDADLTAIAALTPTNDDVLQRKGGAWTNRSPAQLLTDLNLGSLYQPLDADLTTWAGLTPSANAQSLVTAANYAAMRALLDLEAGTDFLSPAAIAAAYQPLDGELTALAGLTSAADKGIQFTGAGTAGTFDLTAAGKALLDDADNTAQRATLGLVIGTDVQAYDAELAAIAGLVSAADRGIYFTGSGTASLFTLTSAARDLLDDANAAAMLSTLGAAAASHAHSAADITSGELSIARGGTGASLSDPNADRILFWDDSAGAVTWLTAGSGLTITDTTITASGGIGGSTGSTDNAILRADGTGGATAQGSAGTISDTGQVATSGTSAGFKASHTSATTPLFLDVLSSGTMSWGSNVDAANAVSDATKPQWRVAISQSSDNYSISRSPAGASWTPSTLFSMSSAGDFVFGSGAILRVNSSTSKIGINRLSPVAMLDVNGSCVHQFLVEANTAGSGAPNVLIAAESLTILTNEGTTAENYHTLPSAAAGYRFLFHVQDADGLRITAASGDTIRTSTGVSATGGFIRCATQGAWILLDSINATEWVEHGERGTWTIDS